MDGNILPFLQKKRNREWTIRIFLILINLLPDYISNILTILDPLNFRWVLFIIAVIFLPRDVSKLSTECLKAE